MEAVGEEVLLESSVCLRGLADVTVMVPGCGFVNVEVWTGDGEIVVSDEEVPRPDRAFFDFVAYYPTDGGPPLRRR